MIWQPSRIAQPITTTPSARRGTSWWSSWRTSTPTWNLLDLSDEAIDELDSDRAFLLRAHRFLPTIKALEFAPVISGAHNDAVDPAGEWTTRSKIDARIARFKMPLFADGPNTFDGDNADPLAFLLVKSMLLTGFDDPVEQVMYLDRPLADSTRMWE